MGNLPHETVTSVAANLANRSFVHAITGANSKNTPITKNPIDTPKAEIGLTTPERRTTPEVLDTPERQTTPERKITPEHNFTPDPLTLETPELNIISYLTNTRYTSNTFYGVVIDTGASQRSTAGYEQYLAYTKTYSEKIDTLRAGMVRVQFGIGTTSSIGSIIIQTSIGKVEFHIVQADTPFLLYLADMDTLGVYYNNITDTLITPTGSIPVTRRFGHPFLLWKETLEPFITESFLQDPCLLTTVELQRLHHRFGHPAADRLHRLLERAGHEDINKKSIEHLTKYCSHCQLHGKSPGRFKFTLRADQNLVFNFSIFVNVMYIDGNPILHIIDEATRFQAAKWLQDLSAKHTWETLRYCWMDTYLGPPDLVTHDAGKNFISKEFRQYTTSLGITTKSVPVEAYWSIDMVERAHPELRRAYNIITEELKGEGISKHITLQMAVKAINDTVGPDGLVPTLLVFGAYPKMTDLDPPTLTVTQQAAAIKKVMEEISKIRAQKQVNNALNQQNGPSVTLIHDTSINAPVLVWREGNTGRSGKWTGPFKLLGINRETC